LYYLKCMEELGTSSSIGKKFQVYISFLHWVWMCVMMGVLEECVFSNYGHKKHMTKS
jgi:hypothetical protein